MAFMLAIVVLFTSTGFSIDMHYCQNELKSVAFFGEAESCHSEKMGTECPNHKSMSSTHDEDDCCHNETIILKSDNDLVTMDFADLTTHQVHFVLAYVHYFIASILAPPTTELEFNLAESPPPERDFQVLFQSFLI